MKTPDDEPRFDGDSDRNNDHDHGEDHDLTEESGVLPGDFPQRLNRLKEASGLSWGGLALAIGVDRKRTRRWGRGVEPCGGAMLSLFRLASRMPGGLDILLGLTAPEAPPQDDEVEGEEDEEDNGET